MTPSISRADSGSDHVLETPRLILRELTFDDADALQEILGDAETMRFYPHPFSREEVVGWIRWTRGLYERHGFGLWALVLKGSGELVGDCGLTIQRVDGEDLVEVGYHVKKTHWRQGLATEAATASRDHAFDVVGVDRLIALVRPENVPSAGVARNLGMRVWKQTTHGALLHDVWSLRRDDHDRLRAG